MVNRSKREGGPVNKGGRFTGVPYRRGWANQDGYVSTGAIPTVTVKGAPAARTPAPALYHTTGLEFVGVAALIAVWLLLG